MGGSGRSTWQDQISYRSNKKITYYCTSRERKKKRKQSRLLHIVRRGCRAKSKKKERKRERLAGDSLGGDIFCIFTLSSAVCRTILALIPNEAHTASGEPEFSTTLLARMPHPVWIIMIILL